ALTLRRLRRHHSAALPVLFYRTRLCHFISYPKAFRIAFRKRGRGPLAAEWKIETLEQFAGFVIGIGRRAYDHVKTQNVIDLVVIDLREHQVLLEAGREVAAAIEALGVQPAEVFDARQRDGDEAVE